MSYRRQTEAFLQGTLALDNDPRMLGYDMAWAQGGVQQVWGLGVPGWRFPFEWLAKAAGQPAFPDRLALAAALTLVCYLLLRLAGPLSKPERLAGALLLILFPPFLTLCRTNFDVYEEAQSYMYLTGVALFGATLGFLRHPTNGRYAILGLLSGFAAFVRPTLVCYGFASIFLAWLVARRQRFALGRLCVAPLLFAAAGALLFLSNHLRFGSGLEFGHRLNVNVFVPMMYATRFENPVAAAPLVPRITELFSYLFLARTELHCCNGYLTGILPGEAPVIRWRDIYFSTYDLSFAAAIATAWGASFLVWWRKHAPLAADLTEAATIGGWSFLSAMPLFLLYLYYPIMSSRYMLDFAPAFAVALWVLIQLVGQFVRELRSEHRLRRPARISGAVVLALAGWWVYQVFTARIFPATGGGVVRAPVLTGPPASSTLPVNLIEYSAGKSIIETRIPFNGYGWERTGRTGAMVILFFRSPSEVELELTPVEGVLLGQRDWEQVRVRVGLDPLLLTSSLQVPGGTRLTFTRRSRPADRSLIEVTFIALASPQDSLRLSKFRLERVRVRQEYDVQR